MNKHRIIPPLRNLMLAACCVIPASCVNRQETAIVQVPAATVAAAQSVSTVHRTRTLTMVAGGTLRISGLMDLDPDCTVHGTPEVREVTSPVHGSIETRQSTGFANYRAPNPRAACNTKRLPVLATFYTPEKGFIGTDSVTIEEIAEGADLMDTVQIIVK